MSSLSPTLFIFLPSSSTTGAINLPAFLPSAVIMCDNVDGANKVPIDPIGEYFFTASAYSPWLILPLAKSIATDLRLSLFFAIGLSFILLTGVATQFCVNCFLILEGAPSSGFFNEYSTLPYCALSKSVPLESTPSKPKAFMTTVDGESILLLLILSIIDFILLFWSFKSLILFILIFLLKYLIIFSILYFKESFSFWVPIAYLFTSFSKLCNLIVPLARL